MTKHKGINLLRSTIGVSLANLITWFLGLFVMLGSSLTSNLYAYFAMFFITVIIDSAFYNAFYSKRQISKLYMILVAFLTSLISYLIIGYGIFLHTGFAEKYLHLLGIQVV
jgi:large-conductance mechanosensitive channel